jgi:hypothetical protein
MTREEAIKQLKGDITENCATFSNQWEKDEEAISMAISALSAEPCRTADDYENEIADLHNRLDIAEYDKERYKEEITTLEVKNKGEWIKIQSGDKDFPESIVCSKCKNENSHLDFNEHGEPIGKVFVTSKFCPNCGAKMKGSE